MVIKETYKISLSILSFLVAFFITTYSHNDGNIFLLLIPTLITGVFIALTMGIFKKGKFKINFIESLKYSFLISSLIYIFGYIFFALEPLFF